MNAHINDVLDRIGEIYHDQIEPDARNYMEVNIGEKARELGYHELYAPLRDVYAVVPLKSPVPGMKVRIDGRTFLNYRRHPAGIAIPGHVAEAAGRGFDRYTARDSMILNFG